MKASLIIISAGRSEALRLTLAACSAHRDFRADEIVVVDDTQDRRLDRVVGSLCVDLPIVLEKGARRGRAAARNAGAVRARHELLVFLDGDILTKPNFMETHIKAQEKTPGLIRGKVRELIGAPLCEDFRRGAAGFPPLDVVSIASAGFNPEGFRLATNSLERAVEAAFESNDPRIPPWIASAGANFGVPKALWDQHEGQCEDFGHDWGCEDLEFAFRICDAQKAVTFAPAAVGYHLSHSHKRQWEQHARSLEIFRRLHVVPEVLALNELLAPAGSVERYCEALGRQILSA